MIKAGASQPKQSTRWSKSIPIAVWPARDRAAWETGLRQGDVFDPGGVASRWSHATRHKTALGYGRYLFFLDQRGELNPTLSPADRITPERLRTYLVELQRTNCGHTIQNRIQELGDAMRALAPEGDWRWILRAAGRLRATTIPALDKRARLRPIEELIAEGLGLMNRAESELRSPLWRAVQYRDGLVVAFLGFHPMRLRNLSELNIGTHIIEEGEQFLIRLPKTKNSNPYEAMLAGKLSDPLRCYLHQHRPVLLAARGRWYAPPGNALWISRHGSPCSEDTFQNIIRKRTGERDRLPLSPHLFRSCAATSVAIRAPGSVDIISVILTHSSPMPGERYYNLATSLEASRAHNAMLDELRGELLRKIRGRHSSARGSTREDGS